MAQINAEVFTGRLTRFVQAWKDDLGGASAFGSIIVPTGKRDMQLLQYFKSVAFHNWLFGIEITDVVVAFTQTGMRILTFQGGKVNVLQTLVEPAAQAGITLEIIPVPKGTEAKDESTKLLEFVRGAAGAVGGLPKLKQKGPLHDKFQDMLAQSDIVLEDAALFFAHLLAIYDLPSALQSAKKSGFLTGSVMNAAQKLIETHVDKRRSIKHSELCEAIREMIVDPSKNGIKLKAENCEVAYLPVVQSGGEFELRVGAESDDRKLHHGVVLLQIGAKYENRCSNICRTLFVNSTPEQEKLYKAIHAAQKAAIGAMVPGASLSSVYAAAQSKLQQEAPADIASKLGKSIGFAMHLELHESKLKLTASNEAELQAGMIFNVSVGLADLQREDAQSSKDKVYAIQVADSVLVKPEGQEAELLTRFAQADWEQISYEIQDEEEEEEEEAADDSEMDVSDDEPNGRSNGRSKENKRSENLGRGRRHANKASETAEKEAEREKWKKRQDELSEKKNQETYRRLTTKADDKEGDGAAVRSTPQVVCYSSAVKVPPQRNLLLAVDQTHECLLLPLMGVHTPFHINTVKGITYSQDGEAQDKVHAHVRIQFNTMPTYDARVSFPKAAFIKELSFRSAKPDAAQKFVQEAQALRRQVLAKDKQDAERATLVKQEKLQRFTNKAPQRLHDVWVYPSMSARKKASGTLEAHYNGLRYSLPNGGDHLDITYSNIKHAIFQSAEKETITLLHFHLKNPIMVGKKKVKDVQVNTEVMTDAAATADARRSAYDPDELEEEQRDRERQKKLNSEFKRFTQRVQDAWDNEHPRLKLEWDKPVRQLAFPGNTGKSTVMLMPTISCLVQLVEVPYTVVTLNDIEIVSLERVGFNTSTFDMVIIFKDFSRDVYPIGSIPAKQLDDIRKWLSVQELKYFESKIPLQWKKLLKQIADDPDSFLEVGGWAGFLDQDGSDEEEDEEESEGFRPSDSGGSGSDAGDESEDSDDESVVDEDEDASDADSDASVGTDEEEGKDWDELEAEARRSDKLREEEDGEGDSSRKRKGGGGRAPPAKKRR